MWQKVSALLKNITNKMNCTSGSMAILFMITIFCFITLIFFNLDSSNRLLVNQSIEDTIGECLSSAGLDNLHESYQPFRDAQVGSYVYNGIFFDEIQNTSAFLEVISNELDIENDNGVLTNYDNDGSIIFRLSNIDIYANNEKGMYVINYDLTIPRNIGTYKLFTYNQTQTVKYQTRF